MSLGLRSVWPAQKIVIDGVGSVDLSPYDMILYDAIINSDDELIIVSLNRGASPDNLIPIVVDRGTPSVIEILVELGANLEKLNEYMNQCQKSALFPQNPYLLLGAGLRKAIFAHNIATVRLILLQMNRDEDGPIKDLALGMAIRNKDPKISLEILKSGHVTPNQGLHYAAQFNDVDAARLMIAQGANVDQVLQLEEGRGLVNMAQFLKSIKGL
jgi:ankyrin repeat protein